MNMSQPEQDKVSPEPESQEDSALKPLLILLIPLVLVLLYGAMN